MIKIAELKLRIVADLTKLKADVKKLMQEKFQVGVEGKGAGGIPSIKEDKKQTSKLAEGIGLLAIIAGILKTVQPIMDFLKWGMAYTFMLLMKVFKWLVTSLPAYLQNIWTKIVEWVKNVWSAIVTWFKNLWEKVKEIPIKIKEFFINLGNKIKEIWGTFIEKVKEIWNVLVTKVVEMKDKFIAKIIELKNILVTKFTEFKQKIIELKDKLVEKFEELRDKIKDKIAELKTKLTDILDSIKLLPQKIWNFFSGLAQAIADRIRNIIPFFGGSNKVDDAIIKPGGQVIKTNPQDFIIATKNPGAMGGSKTFNFYGVTPQEMINVIRRELRNDINVSGRF